MSRDKPRSEQEGQVNHERQSDEEALVQLLGRWGKVEAQSGPYRPDYVVRSDKHVAFIELKSFRDRPERWQDWFVGPQFQRDLAPQERRERKKLAALLESLEAREVFETVGGRKKVPRIQLRANDLQKRIIDGLAEHFGLNTSELIVQIMMLVARKVVDSEFAVEPYSKQQ